ncbi:MAG TPA: hypothetical protein VJZ50_12185 [Candidatus Limnocylindrales bacterium]|nr:hypothetical protein [Candidatus Limnocylindrales bacterium]
MAYAELEPFGPDAEAWRAGMIASVIANAYRDTKKRRQPFTPQDFMPTLPETPDEAAAALQGRITAAMMDMGGRVGTPAERAERAAERARRRKRPKQGGTDGT